MADTISRFDLAFAHDVPADWQRQTLTMAERNYLRSVVTAHDAWPSYRQDWSIDASKLDRRRLLHFCALNDIAWADEIADLPEPPKPRAIPRRGRAPKCPKLSDDPIAQKIGEALWPALYVALREALED